MGRWMGVGVGEVGRRSVGRSVSRMSLGQYQHQYQHQQFETGEIPGVCMRIPSSGDVKEAARRAVKMTACAIVPCAGAACPEMLYGSHGVCKWVLASIVACLITAATIRI